MTKITIIKHFALLFLLTGCFLACSDEQDDRPVIPDGKEKVVSVSVRIPGVSAPKTYAMGATDENEVKTIEVLLFESSGTKDFTGTVLYSNTITDNPGDNSIKTFSVKVPEGTYDMVILANARDIVSNALGGINIGDPKALALEKLLLTKGKWNAAPGSTGYIPIPMWGEIQNITINASTPALNTVDLLRMVAKIDVDLSTTARGKLNLQSVRLYNYNNQGQIAPDAANWNSASNLATAPSVPSTATKQATPLLYSGTEIVQDGGGRGISCVGEIYTFEAPKGTDATLPNNTCLVIGGTFGTDANETFYRVDFVNTNASGVSSYLDLLRNHVYNVTISDISASGYTTADEAFKALPVNITYGIYTWNDGKYTDFVLNDQYMLGVTQKEFKFSTAAHTAASTDNTLGIVCDYPGGWSAKVVDDQGAAVTWLTCSPSSSTTANYPVGQDIKLIVDAQPVNGLMRDAFVHITSGRLEYVVKVTQMGQFYPPMHSGWAGSNIYYDAALGHLTFDDVNVKTHQYYQGVYFQWGSLWGIDPIGAPGSVWSTTTTLYSPNGGSDAANSYFSGAWSSWPRVPDTNITSNPPSGKTARYRAYLYEIHNPATGVGDICRLLTEKGWAPGSPAKKWRMPTSQEFEAAANYTRYGTWATVPSNNAAGQFTVGPGYTKTGTGTPAFPASGGRTSSTGSLYGVGHDGYYWSGSPNGTSGYFLNFTSGSVTPGPNSTNYRAYGFPVRCVAE